MRQLLSGIRYTRINRLAPHSSSNLCDGHGLQPSNPVATHMANRKYTRVWTPLDLQARPHKALCLKLLFHTSLHLRTMCLSMCPLSTQSIKKWDGCI